jgi:hypothetical protein
MSGTHGNHDTVRQWCYTALRRDVVGRSIKVGLLVGTILVLINYTDRIIAAELTTTDYFKMVLTYFVPYCVSTYATVCTILKGG